MQLINKDGVIFTKNVIQNLAISMLVSEDSAVWKVNVSTVV